jgi:hypothetical protein
MCLRANRLSAVSTEQGPTTTPTSEPGPMPGLEPKPTASTRTLRLSGTVPPEVWNRLGTKILPKLRAGSDLKIGLEFSVTVSDDSANGKASHRFSNGRPKRAGAGKGETEADQL